MVTRTSTPSSRPMATPAKAEWLIASEKKAMRKLTTWTPMAAHIGARSTSPTRACCMNGYCMQSRASLPVNWWNTLAKKAMES